MPISFRVSGATAAAFLLSSLAAVAGPIGYYQTNLVSDIPGMASTFDPNLKNPWGISFNPASPFWISENGSGAAAVYNGAGKLLLTVPITNDGTPGGAPLAPTGQVFNTGNGAGAFNKDLFVFASEDGIISGWRGGLTAAEVLFDNSGANSVYKGLAIATVNGNTYLYATDFHNNQINVFPSSGAPALSGNFTDPTLLAGYAPFDVQVLNGKLYVTYALQKPGAHDDQAGPGNGFLSVFDLNGNFQGRLLSNGKLNSPWGLTIAPSNWGAFGGDLLVGNFGDGKINAYNLNGVFQGTVSGANGNPLVNDGLWALAVGNGTVGSASSVYLTAGLNGEADGLFAQIDPVPEPGAFALLGIGLTLGWWRRRSLSRRAI